MTNKDYAHLYGPVPSRRLGRSLGVDIVPLKVCSYDCVYCQLGRTTRLTAEPEELVDADEVMSELERWLAKGNTADYITFAGSGEPTLNSDLGAMISRTRELTDIPSAVITNGALLSDLSVIQGVLEADLLVPSLDAGTEETFRRINRPCEGLTLEMVVEGLRLLRQEFAGAIWLEVMLVRDLNDSDAELAAISAVISGLGPDKVQINTVERPSRSGGVSAVSPETLEKAREILGPSSEVITAQPDDRQAVRVEGSKSEVLQLLKRRPCTLGDIIAGTGLHVNEVVKILRDLMTDGLIESAGRPADPHYRPAINAVRAGTPEDA